MTFEEFFKSIEDRIKERFEYVGETDRVVINSMTLRALDLLSGELSDQAFILYCKENEKI